LNAAKIAKFEFMNYYNLSKVKEQLSDSSKAIADLTSNMVYEEPGLLKPLLDISWNDKEPWSQRASRVVSICCCKFPDLAKPYVSDIIRKLPVQKSEGARRNFLKFFTQGKVRLKSRDKSILLNACFDFLTGHYSVAVKVYSLDILYILSRDLPDIQRELYEIIMDQMEDSSAGYKSHATKILKKLDRQAGSRKAGIGEDR